jgi:hypothetical protein
MTQYRFDVQTDHYGSWSFCKEFETEEQANERAESIQSVLDDSGMLIDFKEIGRCKPIGLTDDDGIYRPFATESN